MTKDTITTTEYSSYPFNCFSVVVLNSGTDLKRELLVSVPLHVLVSFYFTNNQDPGYMDKNLYISSTEWWVWEDRRGLGSDSGV